MIDVIEVSPIDLRQRGRPREHALHVACRMYTNSTNTDPPYAPPYTEMAANSRSSVIQNDQTGCCLSSGHGDHPYLNRRNDVVNLPET